MSDQKLEALKATSLFATCTKKEMELIGRITDRVTLPAGKVIVHQGSVPTHMSILISGAAIVEADGTKLAELGPRDVIGELSLVDNRKASATVTTTVESTAWHIAQGSFKPVWKKHPEMSTSLLTAVVARLRAANELAI